MPQTKLKPKKFRTGNLLAILLILAVLVGIPFLILTMQAKRSGMSRSDVIRRVVNKQAKKQDDLTAVTLGENIHFLDPAQVGDAFTQPPLISNIAVDDIDFDSIPEILVCDARSNTVSLIDHPLKGSYTEKIIAADIIAPAHVSVIDFDKDGDKDILVAVLGLLFPSNDKIGSVVILENKGNGSFNKHVIAEKIARVSDVRAGDIDGDGDMDLAVAQFGYDDGETRWMENQGNWKFESHILQHLSGGINVELTDIDKDGDLDIFSLISQEWEEIYLFENDGAGNFTTRLIYGSSNEDYGSSGIYMSDLDQDGDQDVLYTNGDAFDYIPPQGRPWHGVQWLENMGNLHFEFHRICDFIGAYNARPMDLDNDGDLDLFAVSAFNLWSNADAMSIIWLENDGKQQFIKHDITSNPTHIITLETGDFNGDGLMDFATGGMHAYPPYDRMSRISVWTNNGALSNKDRK